MMAIVIDDVVGTGPRFSPLLPNERSAMRMLIQAKLSHAKFNAAVKDGSISSKVQRILADAKPEAAYFTEVDGHRTAILIVQVNEASKIPSFAEPWFLHFEADINLRPVMTPEDLSKAGLDALAKKWA
jgi:hypothetical protein